MLKKRLVMTAFALSSLFATTVANATPIFVKNDGIVTFRLMKYAGDTPKSLSLRRQNGSIINIYQGVTLLDEVRLPTVFKLSNFKVGEKLDLIFETILFNNNTVLTSPAEDRAIMSFNEDAAVTTLRFADYDSIGGASQHDGLITRLSNTTAHPSITSAVPEASTYALWIAGLMLIGLSRQSERSFLKNRVM